MSEIQQTAAAQPSLGGWLLRDTMLLGTFTAVLWLCQLWHGAAPSVVAAAVGVVLGFVGVAVLIGASLQNGWQASTIGQLAVFGATISYGCAGVFGRRFANVPPVETARGQLTMSSVLILPLVLLIDHPWELVMPSQASIWSVLLLAILCTAIAYLLFFQILATAGAVNVSLVTFLVPPSAIILGIIVLNETLEIHHIIGMAIIMAGLIVIDGRLLKK